MNVGLEHYLVVSALLFALGLLGVIVRRNLIVIYMSLELMLNSANLALVSFSANSILCRLALGDGTIDPASFTTIRLAAGAAMLSTISLATEPAAPTRVAAPRWRSAVALFLYAIAFSLAYVSLTAGTGALLLFGAVQTTMLVSALNSGERPEWREWAGLAAAVVGLVYLVSPGLTAPPLVGSALMLLSGVAWGYYSLWGRSSSDPLADTGINFVRSVPMTAIVRPEVASAVVWASVSIPAASPDTIVQSALTNSRTSFRARRMPSSDGCRVPTTATQLVSTRSQKPRK